MYAKIKRNNVEPILISFGHCQYLNKREMVDELDGDDG
jgi:hypothetical protein